MKILQYKLAKKEYDRKRYLRLRKPCVDCGVLVAHTSKRCWDCSKKLRVGVSINIGDKNGMWKGECVGYHALHEWIIKRKPKPNLCEKCKERPPKDLANISGKYKRDVNDFEWICRKCHMVKDGRVFNLKNIKR